MLLCVDGDAAARKETVSTLSQFCGGQDRRARGRRRPGTRARGLGDQPREWQSFDPSAGAGE